MVGSSDLSDTTASVSPASRARRHDDQSWVQKFTPRKAKSGWSKINRDKVGVLTAAGRIRPAGLLAVELAKADGRWDAA